VAAKKAMWCLANEGRERNIWFEIGQKRRQISNTDGSARLYLRLKDISFIIFEVAQENLVNWGLLKK
jgi:hypothetical protein